MTTREEAIELAREAGAGVAYSNVVFIADPVQFSIRLINLAKAKENEATIEMLQKASGEMVLIQDVIATIRARMKP